MLVPAALHGIVINARYALPLGLSVAFSADALAVFMALVSLFVGLIIVVYSFDYISHYEFQQEYYLLVVLFLGAMMGIVFSASLIYLYVFWEITAIVSWRLIGFFRAKNDVIRAEKSFLITGAGAFVMLIGFIMLYQQAGSFELSVLRPYFCLHPVPSLAVLLILAGILSKSATLPFHTWLPDAGVAPSPVTALLHAAVLVKIGVYVFARLFVWTLPIALMWQTVIPLVAAASAIISGAAALRETDIKRIIAYSTVSQIGFIFFGLAIGNPIGIAGGLLYILMHGMAKAGLFLCAGIVEQNTHTKDITKMGGLARTMPWTALAFFGCSFSVMGVPPFGGFFSKYLVFLGAVQGGDFLLTGLFLAAALITILYLLRLGKALFFGDCKIEAREGSPVMVGSVVALAVLSLVGGIAVYYPLQLVQVAITQMVVR